MGDKYHDAKSDQAGEAYPCKQPSAVAMCKDSSSKDNAKGKSGKMPAGNTDPHKKTGKKDDY